MLPFENASYAAIRWMSNDVCQILALHKPIAIKDPLIHAPLTRFVSICLLRDGSSDFPTRFYALGILKVFFHCERGFARENIGRHEEAEKRRCAVEIWSVLLTSSSRSFPSVSSPYRKCGHPEYGI